MNITQRQIVLVLLGSITFFLLILAIVTAVQTLTSASVQQGGGLQGESLVSLSIGVVGFIVFAGLLIAYWFGWEYSRHVTVLIVTVLCAFAIETPSEFFNLGAVFVPLVALVLAGPSWVVGSGVFIMVTLFIRSGGTGVYGLSLTTLVYAMIVGGLILSRLKIDVSLKAALENERRADAERAIAEQQRQETASLVAELAQQNQQQRQLLDLVTSLETPVVQLTDDVLLAPVVGTLDSRRAGLLTSRLLEAVSERRAQMVVIDITGVAAIDTQIAKMLMQMVRAVRLLGCDVTLTGISASVATSLTHLGIDMGSVRTARSPQDVLMVALRQQGVINGTRET